MTTVVGSPSGHRAAHDHVRARERDRLLEAVHEPRHQHHDIETDQGDAGRLLVPVPVVLRDLDVRHLRLHRRQRRAVPRQPVQVNAIVTYMTFVCFSNLRATW